LYVRVFFFFSQFCDVGELVIIHKRIKPNLVKGSKQKWKYFQTLL
jgi:hypothetical protein